VLVRHAVGAPEDGAVRRGGGSSAEEEAQLPRTRRWRGASWGVAGAKKSFAGEDAGDVVGAFGDLDEAHASAASRDGAGGDIDGEDAAQEPGPRVAGCLGRGRRERGEVGGGEERELRRRLGLAAEDDFGTRGRVRGEDGVIAEHVKPWRRDEGAEPREEVEGVEQDGVGAVFPRSLEGEADAAVAVKLEALLVERRARDSGRAARGVCGRGRPP
jgi:hypothetical protein